MRAYRPTAGSAPSRLVASPRRHSSRSRPTSHDGVSLGRAMGLWNLAIGIDQQLQSHLHKYPKRYRICCASPSAADQLLLTGPHSAFPEKLETRLHCPPICQAPEKDCNYPGLVHRSFVTHVSPAVFSRQVSTTS